MCCTITILGDIGPYEQFLLEMGAQYNEDIGRWQLYPAFTNELRDLEEMGLSYKMEYLKFNDTRK